MPCAGLFGWEITNILCKYCEGPAGRLERSLECDHEIEVGEEGHGRAGPEENLSNHFEDFWVSGNLQASERGVDMFWNRDLLFHDSIASAHCVINIVWGDVARGAVLAEYVLHSINEYKQDLRLIWTILVQCFF